MFGFLAIYSMAKHKKNARITQKTHLKTNDKKSVTLEPIASRTRSKKQNIIAEEINPSVKTNIDQLIKPTFKLKHCTVRLTKLTTEQISNLIGNDLVKIGQNEIKSYNLRSHIEKKIVPKMACKTKPRPKVASAIISTSEPTAAAFWKFLKQSVPMVVPKMATYVHGHA